MTRSRTILAVAGVLFVIFTVWVANNTYWEDQEVPMPLKGEALENPFYAAQRLAESLGARTMRDRVLVVPKSDAVIVLSSWSWALSPRRRAALEAWVESGGRLVTDWSLREREEFERWSGILRKYRDVSGVPSAWNESSASSCHRFDEAGDTVPWPAPRSQHWLCDYDPSSTLRTDKPIVWALTENAGTQVIRVRVGRGHVTMINAGPFQYRSLFNGDHGWLFVAATELRRGDEIHFLTETEYPSLLALIWRHGAPVVGLSLASVLLALWRGGVRLGPLAPAPENVRRSLAEQIRGTAQFVLRFGGGDALHGAAVRALDEAARRRISGYGQLQPRERAAALAHVTGFEREAIAAAVYHPALRHAHELQETLSLIETARRRLISDTRDSTHGSH